MGDAIRLSPLSARERVLDRLQSGVILPPPLPPVITAVPTESRCRPHPTRIESRQRPHSARSTAITGARLPNKATSQDLLWTATNGWTGWSGASLSPWTVGSAPHPINISRQHYLAESQRKQFEQFKILAKLQVEHRSRGMRPLSHTRTWKE